MKSKDATQFGVQSRFSRQRGASLLEGIAYLGIAAIVVLGAVSLLTSAFGNAKANQTTEEVTAMRTAVRKLYTGQPYPNADLLPTMIVANAIPNTLVVDRDDETVANSWAGAVTVTGDGAGNFTISYANVPQDVCVSVVSGANGWNRISDANTNLTTFPVTAADALTVCDGPTNTVSFRSI